MKRTAASTQRHTRWSLGCALVDVEQPGMSAGLVRPEYFSNRIAPRGSAPV